MADEVTNVRYNFEGNIDSLKQATENAINILDSYQKKISALVAEGSYTPNKKVAKSMQTAMAGVTKEIEAIQKSIKSVGDIQVFKGTPEANQLSAAFRNLQADLTRFSKQTSVSTKYVHNLVTSMRNTKQTLHEVAPAIDTLVTKEQNFQDKIRAIQQQSADMATRVRDAFAAISQPFDPIIAKFESFKAKASEALNHIKQEIDAVGRGFRQMGEDADAAADGEDEVGDSAKDSNPKVEAFKKVLEGLKKVAQVTLPVLKKLASAGINAVANKLKDAVPKVDDLSGKLNTLKHIIGSLLIGKVIGEATTEAISFIENLNLFTVAMGDAIDEANRFVDAMSDIYGMDPSNLYRYAGYFNQLTDAIGMTSEASKVISLSLTKASNDIASLFNVEIEQVVNNIASGMQGMSMAVRKYGIDIRRTTLQQTALNYGFTENVATTSEANRQALRYLTIMDQVKNATKQVTSTVNGTNQVMGDFARNIETPANQLRIMKEQISQIARGLGNFFIPVMQKVLYVINGVLMALKELLFFLAALAGIDVSGFGGSVSKGANEATGAVGGIGDAAEGAAKKLKDLVAPFDELNILAQDTGDAGGVGGIGGIGDTLDPALLKAIENMQLGLDDIRMKAMDIRDKLLELLGLKFKDGELTVTLGGFIDDLMKLWDKADYKGFGARFAEFFNQGIQWGLENLQVSKFGPIIRDKVWALTAALNGAVESFDWKGLGTLIGQGINISLIAANAFLSGFDWYALGAQIGNGINGAVESIDWGLLGDTIGKGILAKLNAISGFIEQVKWADLGLKISEGLNSLVATIGWRAPSDLLANGVNALFDTIRNIAETFDWATFGSNLGSGIMNAITSINWDGIGATLGGFVNGIVSTIKSYFVNYEWGTLGTSLADGVSKAVKTVNWLHLGQAVSDTIRGLLREVINFLSQLDWVAIGEAIVQFILGIDWLGLLTDLCEAVVGILGAAVRLVLGLIVGIFSGIGTLVVDGFKDGIIQGFINIGVWLKEHFVDPIVNAVKNFFGIHSPSRVFAEIAGFIVDGFKNGIIEPIKGIGTWIKENFIDPIVNKVREFFGISGDSSSVFSNIGGQLINGLFNGLKNIGNRVIEWGSGIINSVKNVFGIHSPSREFEIIGDYMTQGLYMGVENTKQIEVMYQQMLKNMTIQTNLFTNNAAEQFMLLAAKSTEATNRAMQQQKTLTTNMINMYTVMANNSVAQIQKVIDALNRIPRNITTTHTVVTVGGSSIGGSGSGLAALFGGGGNNSGYGSWANNSNWLGVGPSMATGGVVTGPTRALIGEGHYDEAVIPLGNSPQVDELLNKISDKVGGQSEPVAVDVTVYIGDKEWDAFTYKSAERGKRLVGAQPVKGRKK